MLNTIKVFLVKLDYVGLFVLLTGDFNMGLSDMAYQTIAAAVVVKELCTVTTVA